MNIRILFTSDTLCVRQEHICHPSWFGMSIYLVTFNPIIGAIAALLMLIFVAVRLPYMSQ